ncbi:MAG: carbohydrate porin [Acidiferrobacter sp.]
MSHIFVGLCTVAWLAAAGSVAYGHNRETTRTLGSGLGVNGTFQGGVVSNLAGGIARGSVGNALFVGGISWNSARAGDWSGGQFVADILAVATGNPEAYVGDTQGVSNLTIAGRLTRLYRCYVRQRWRGVGVARAGLLNANDYFDDTGVATDLLNASYGIFPTISGNLPGTSTYPYSSLGIMVSAGGPGTTVQVGVFGADAAHPGRQPLGQGHMLYAEVDRRGHAGDGGAYTLKGGVWDNVVGPVQVQTTGPHTQGFYGIGEYRWHWDALRCGTFFEGGGAPQRVNAIPWYLAAGVRIAGWFPAQPHDALTVGVNRAVLAGLPAAESVYEITALFDLYPGIAVQPDVQIVVHPSGIYPTALVGSLRLRVNVADVL